LNWRGIYFLSLNQYSEGLEQNLIQIEKGREVSTLFVPNLTINLTYLCYGSTKILVLWEIKKEFLDFFFNKIQREKVKNTLNSVNYWGSKK